MTAAADSNSERPKGTIAFSPNAFGLNYGRWRREA